VVDQSSFFGVRKAVQLSGASLVVLAAVGGSVPEAAAQDRFFYRDPYFQRYDAPPPRLYEPRRPEQRGRPAARQSQKPAVKQAEKVKEAPPPGPHMLIVSVKSQNVSFYAGGKLVSQSPVSTGKATNPTPFGVFSVIQRNRHHRSNIYSGAPMPYMQRLTWSGIALHEGRLPGYPASHGCIRLPERYADYLWRTIKMNTREIVSREDVAPVDIAHPLLFQPKPSSATVEAAPELRKTLDTTSAQRVRIALADTIATDGHGERMDGEDAKPAMRDLTESVEKSNASGRTETGIATPAAVDNQPDAASENRPAPDAVKLDTAAPAQADTSGDAVAKPELAVDQPTKDDVSADATASIYPQPASIPAPILASFAQSLDAKQKKAAPSGNVTVFISKKDKRLYVRQHFIPLFDAPVSFKNDKGNFGTHVFSALEKDGGDKELRWTVVTMPQELPKTEKIKTRVVIDRYGRSVEVPVKSHGKAPEPSPSLGAAAVLDQIEIAPDVVARISEYVAPGSSLIVSDYGLGHETGLYTDFIVVTR
jgi:lipoprotein-anchoring transpeptidase ErfK/SrfK